MALNPTDPALIHSASADAASAAARDMVHHLNSQRWLAPSNRYRYLTIRKIEEDVKPHHRVRPGELSQYIAASGPLHCADGWSYLGHAINAHIMGDRDTSRHLAYYAELRAALSLLATQGIGVFNHNHFVIVERNHVEQLSSHGGTHSITWDILAEWSTTGGGTRCADLLGRILRPARIPLETWFAEMSLSSWQPVAKSWINLLGYDLKILRDDHNARNDSSYRPTRLHPTRQLTCHEAVSAVVEILRLLEPSPGLPFGNIDQYLLREVIEESFFATTDRRPRQAPRRFDALLSRTVVRMNLDPMTEMWLRFLRRVEAPNGSLLLNLAKKEKNQARPEGHLSIIARALLLLRVAAGAVDKMLSDAGVGFEELEFWWGSYGTDRGLWTAAPAATGVADIWEDFRSVLDFMSSWLSQSPSGQDHHTFLLSVPGVGVALSGLCAVGIWGLVS